MTRCLLVVAMLGLQLGIISAETSSPPSACVTRCSCEESDDEDDRVTKQEGLAAAVGALTPLVLGGAGLGLYKLLRGGTANQSGSYCSPEMSSPRFEKKRGSIPSYKDSPPLYHGSRRGSTPVSLFGEEDEISFESTPKTTRPDTTSTYTNIHRPYKADAVNRWM